VIEIIHGDCVEEMRKLAPDSADAIVTDPPYLLGFMGKQWDKAEKQQEWHAAWAIEALRVLKPGGHLLAFGGTRTYHRMTCAIEDAGFEIRDCIQWIYGSGFPKSHDISKAIDKMAGAEREVVGTYRVTGNALTPTKEKGGTFGVGVPNSPGGNLNITTPATPEAQQWDGWGTALKPACEPIVVARKPLSEKTVAKNVLEHGTGALNIDASRISGEPVPVNVLEEWSGFGQKKRPDYTPTVNTQGRWPANVILDEDAAALLDEQSGTSKSTGGQASLGAFRNGDIYGKGRDEREKRDPGYGDVGGASRFFYTAKASKKERGEGNNHPTVKPLTLMRYLVRLVTPPGGLVLDPFMGSGTTGLACADEGFSFIGIEMEDEYIEIARRRIAFRQQSMLQS
jgi:DNA modification methylase